MRKKVENVRNKDLNKSNKNHSGQYYQQTRSSKRKNIRDKGQDQGASPCRQSHTEKRIPITTTYKNTGTWSKDQTKNSQGGKRS
jgi:hypothetical protein